MAAGGPRFLRRVSARYLIGFFGVPQAERFCTHHQVAALNPARPSAGPAYLLDIMKTEDIVLQLCVVCRGQGCKRCSGKGVITSIHRPWGGGRKPGSHTTCDATNSQARSRIVPSEVAVERVVPERERVVTKTRNVHRHRLAPKRSQHRLG